MKEQNLVTIIIRGAEEKQFTECWKKTAPTDAGNAGDIVRVSSDLPAVSVKEL